MVSKAMRSNKKTPRFDLHYSIYFLLEKIIGNNRPSFYGFKSNIGPVIYLVPLDFIDQFIGFRLSLFYAVA